jgi:putative peptidoglycan lipid II flippase
VNLSKKSLKINTVILVLFGIISSLLGFIREIQIANYFGLSIGADIYYLGTFIPELIVTIVGAAASNIYMKQYHMHENKRRYAGSVLVLLSIMVFIIFVLVLFIFPFVASLLAPGLEVNELSTFIKVGRLMLVAMLASVFLGVVVATLNINGRFLLTGLNGVVFNVLLIIIAYFLVPKVDIYGLAWSYLIAHIGRLIFLLSTTFKYFQITTTIKHSFQLLKEIPRVALVNLSGSIQVYFERSFSSTIGEGTIAALNYAGKITTLPNILFINSILTVVFPKLITESYEDKESFSKTVLFALKVIMIGLICAELFIVLFNNDIVVLLLENGKFTNDDTHKISTLFYFYAPIVVISGAIQVLLRVAYALEKNSLTVRVMYYPLPFYIVTLYLVKDYFSIYGFPLSLLIYNIIICFLLFQGLSKEEDIKISPDLHQYYSIFIIVLIITSIKILIPISPNNILLLFVFFFMYLIVFFTLLFLMDKECRHFANLLKSNLLNKRQK